MFRLQKWILTCLIIFMMAALSACNLGLATEPTTEPTATEVDLNAINTAAVATVQAQLTLNAAAIAPISTATLSPSETPSPEITDTPGNVLVETTPTPTETPLLSTTDLSPTATPLPGATAIPSFTPIVAGGGSGGSTDGSLCQNSQLASETVPDGTVFKPGATFTKTWVIQNTGTCVWDEGFYLAAWSGPDGMGPDRPARYINSSKDFVQPGGQIVIYVDMVAPDKPGDYTAVWSMYNDSNIAFGTNVTVVIKVVK
jgi:hypothetical protein